MKISDFIKEMQEAEQHGVTEIAFGDYNSCLNKAYYAGYKLLRLNEKMYIQPNYDKEVVKC